MAAGRNQITAQVLKSKPAQVAEFGCNGAVPQTAVASGAALNAYAAGANGLAAAADVQALVNLVNTMQAALKACGILS